MVKIRSGLFVVVLAASAAPPAFASYSEPAAGLQCNGYTIAVRFGRSDSGAPADFDPLPPEYEEQWKDVPFAKDNRCTLANGVRVEMHGGIGQAYAWGAGGADPNAFFSLWIDGRKVVAKENFYYGYDGAGALLNSLFVTGNSISRCAYPNGRRRWDSDRWQEPACALTSVDIAALPVDALLPSVEGQALVGTISIAAAYNPAFCRSFVSPPMVANGIGPQELKLPPDAKPFFATGYAQRAGEKLDYVATHTRVDQFDLWNNGQIGTGVLVSDYMKFFVGDVLFYRSRLASEEDIKSIREQGVRGGRTGVHAKLASELGWSTAGVEPDNDPYPHTSREFFRLGDSTYLLERPAFRREATLYRPQWIPQRSPSLETICSFRWIEQYF